MNKQDSISIAVWTEKSNELLKHTQQLLQKIGYSTSGMPQNVFEGNKPLSIVFAGQYSAGKSSILKSLTGIEDIEIDEGITTQEAHSYDWNGIKVVDTPGIHTILRPDHDEIAYQAIANSDMLVYVVTKELFDDFIGQNFRKLLIEKDKASEMILVVNKMADIGNTIENQEIKLKDLEKVTAPYTPAQLRTVFIDVKSYLESVSEPDQELAELLRIRSNYDSLVETLNTFINEKAISARITTVLYRLFDFLQKAMVEYQPTTGDNDIDALEEHLLQERHIIVNSQWQIETAVKAIIEDTVSQIREKGRNIANSIYNFENEDDANEAIEKAYKDVEIITATCVDKVIHKITELSNNCQVLLDKFYKSDFSRNLKVRLENKQKKECPIINRLFKSDVLSQTGNKIVENTAGANVTASGLRAFSGSNIHQIVLDIGHFFGHSFKPWEAVKLVKGINAVGKALGVVGVVFSLGMQIKEDVDADELQQEMRANREKLRAAFNTAANEVTKYFYTALANFLAENYLAQINQIDAQISEIRNMRINKSKTYKMLENAQTECKRLISDIHQNYTPSDKSNN